MFFPAREPIFEMMIAAEPSTIDMVPVPIDLMISDPDGSLSLVTIMVWNRYRFLDTSLGKAVTGTSQLRNGESPPQLAYGVLTAT
jgi:hypothetical protein